MIVAAFEHERHPRAADVFHHHHGADRLFASGDFGLQLGNFLADVLVGLVVTVEIVSDERRPFRFSPRGRILREERANRVAAGEGRDFGFAQRSTVKPHVINAAGERRAGVAAADVERLVGANRIAELVVLDRPFLGLAVEIDLDAGRFAGAVVGDEHMLPDIGLERRFRVDLDRVVGPRVDDVHGDGVALRKNVVAAVAVGVVHAGDHRAVAAAGRLHPRAIAERVSAFEIADVAGVDEISASELERAGVFAFAPGGVAVDLAGSFFAVEGDSNFGAGRFVERQVRQQIARQQRLIFRRRRGRLRPSVELRADILRRAARVSLRARESASSSLPTGRRGRRRALERPAPGCRRAFACRGRTPD